MLLVLVLAFVASTLFTGVGLYLARKYSAAASHSGIGGSDLNRQGCLGVLGDVMFVWGLIEMIISGFLLYSTLFR